MKVFVTGATGFIGRALVLRLLGDGHQVTAWVRSVERARSQLGADASLVPIDGGDAALEAALSDADAVVNLAGEPIVAGRWTKARKLALLDSRVGLTLRLVDAIQRIAKRPKVLVSGSAIGIYGNRGAAVLDEASPEAKDFLGDLCARWESAALGAEPLGVRVALIRTGVVLGPEGGALEKMLPLFRAGGGGRLGSGRQFMSWIHLRDLVEMFSTALTDARWRGAFNGTAPNPVDNRKFTRELGRALHRPAILPAPAPALRLLLGEAAQVLLEGQRVLPLRALALGFRFRFETVDGALRAIVSSESTRIEPISSDTPVPVATSSYLVRRRPTHLLRHETRIDAPLEETFSFFSRAENLGLLTPAAMQFRITAGPAAMRVGAIIDYAIQLGPIPITWRTVIEKWDAGRVFVDSQEKGPYRCWWHEHHFRRDGATTLMEDRVYFAAPFGPIGRIADRLFIPSQLRRIFAYRAEAIALRFETRRPRLLRSDAAPRVQSSQPAA